MSNTSPIFTLTPRVDVAQISTANTNRNGTGSLSVVLVAGVSGTLVEYVRVQAIGTVTAGVVRLYISGGTQVFLWKEILVTATTPSTSVEAFSAEYVPTKPLVLPPGHAIEASTHNAETFNVFAHAGDF